MITTKKELKMFLIEDSKANKRKSIRKHFFGDEIWKYIVSMRKLDYYFNKFKSNKFYCFQYFFYKRLFHIYSVKLSFSISNYSNIGYGFSIAHIGNVVINSNAKIGNYCRVHEGVCIGSTNGEKGAPLIGDYVFVGTGAKIIGDISIASNVAIGANAVVVKSIEESHTTWGGVPAKLISSNDSSSNLSKFIL